MRVVTAFKRMLRLDGWASVIDVSFDQKGVIVTLKLRRRRRRICSVCGQTVGIWRSSTTAPSAGGISIWVSTVAFWSASSDGCAARTAGCATRPSAGPDPARRIRGTSRTWWCAMRRR